MHDTIIIFLESTDRSSHSHIMFWNFSHIDYWLLANDMHVSKN